MRHNPKHQFHIFLRRHALPFKILCGYTCIGNIRVEYRYEEETIHLFSLDNYRLTYTFPFCEPVNIYKKFLRFREAIKRLNSINVERLQRQMEFEHLYPRPRNISHPQFRNFSSPIN